MINIDILILGGGVSGHLMSQRLMLSNLFLESLIVDKGDDVSIHPFHLHRCIPEISNLSNLKEAWLETNIWDGFEFKREPSLLDCNNFSKKVYGQIQVTNLLMQKSIKIYPVNKMEITNNGNQLIDYVESVDLINKIVIGKKEKYQYKYLVNTIALPVFLNLCNFKHNFDFVIYPYYTAKIDFHKTNMYQMIYNSFEKCSIRRVTLLDDILYIESNKPELKSYDDFFLKMIYSIGESAQIDFKLLSPGKFKYLDNRKRKALFYYLTAKYDVFCLGRYGAWTHKVTNDVWDDTKQIENWIYAKEQVYTFEKEIKCL